MKPVLCASYKQIEVRLVYNSPKAKKNCPLKARNTEESLLTGDVVRKWLDLRIEYTANLRKFLPSLLFLPVSPLLNYVKPSRPYHYSRSYFCDLNTCLWFDLPSPVRGISCWVSCELSRQCSSHYPGDFKPTDIMSLQLHSLAFRIGCKMAHIDVSSQLVKSQPGEKLY